MKKFKSMITEFIQESEVIDTFEGPFTSGNFVRIGIEDVEFSSGQPLDKWEFLGKEVTIMIGESEPEAPKQELPVIPKCVADWITRYREKYDLYPALRLLENNTFVWGEIYEWYRMNTRKFVNAYFTGEYEVEDEQKYYVDLDTAAYVAKWKDNDRVDIYTDGISGSDEFEFHLTEEEIKNYDPRYWPFAVKVEEIEE